MAITVRVFASLRELKGVASLSVDLEAGDTAASVFERLFGDTEQAALAPSLLFAVNQEYVERNHSLQDGDELAFIPPIGGGAPPQRVFLGTEPLSLQPLIDLVSGHDRGGVATFTGTVRDHFEGRAVTHLDYEAYQDMALQEMERLCQRIEAQWPGVAVAMAHRLGRMTPGEAAVQVVAAGPHRAEAFAACRFGIDALKEGVPIFKKESYDDGSTWKSNEANQLTAAPKTSGTDSD